MSRRENQKNAKIKPPLLPAEAAEAEIQVSDEDVEFVRRNKRYAGFLNSLDTEKITKHVIGLNDDAEEGLESYFEKRVEKSRLEKEEKEKSARLSLDPASVLPIKTLSGELRYKTDLNVNATLQEHEEGTLGDSRVKLDKATEAKKKLTKAERRRELKKEKRKAKTGAKEETAVDIKSNDVNAGVLEKLRQDLSMEESFASRKAYIAEIGTSLLADPEKNVGTLKELNVMCSDDEDVRIRRLALLSLLAVFKDIIPGYRIRLPTEKELQTKASKEVEKLRNYEATVLRNYQRYLRTLISLVKESSFKQIAIQCMCILLEYIPHFNYTDNLLAAVVPLMSSVDDLTRKQSCSAVKSLFLNEGKHRGEATVEAVKLIADLVKRHKSCLHPDVIEVYLSLSFDEDLCRQNNLETEGRKTYKDRLNARGKNENKVKKQELAAKLREEVEADVKSAFNATDSMERRKMQTKTIAAMFETYFRILKYALEPQQDMTNTNKGSMHAGSGQHPLLLSCLKGIGKFSHLINVDFMGDLFTLLRKLAAGYGMNKTNGARFPLNLTVPERLKCCVVAFKMLRSNLDALNIDLREFYVEFYNLLAECQPERDDQGIAIAEALQIMLCEGRQHDMQRAAAFTKRLASLSLQFGSSEAVTVLMAVKNLLQKYAKCRCLLDNDGGGGSVGGMVAVYQPEASDPELSGALSSVLWEMALLSNHYHPAVSELAHNIVNMNINRNQVLSILSPLEALKAYSTTRGLFNPPLQMAKAPNKRKSDHLDSGLSSSLCEGIKSSIKKDNVGHKFTTHFKFVRAMKENERLIKEKKRSESLLDMHLKYKDCRKRSRKKLKSS